MKNTLILLLIIQLKPALCTAQINEWSDHQLRILIDSIVVNNMDEYNIPGVGYALVRNGRVVYLASYGMANLETGQKVNNDTKFMLGSIAKFFTTVAVLQLYEEGEVSLDEDINTYLNSFQLPYTITLRQLLTHTGGLEESVFERIKKSQEQFILLEDYLKKYFPDQFLSPGKYPAYSNHGMSLAGLVVQEKSGIRFEDFVQQRIFKSLGMNNSTFDLDETSKKNLASSYKLEKGVYQKMALEYVQTIPASMLISTNGDMAKFMMFLLNPDQSKILKPETLLMMQSTQYTPHQNLWGRGFGFFERNYRGNRILEHGGSRNEFYGQLSIIPEDGLGIFIIYNGGKSNYRNEVTFNFIGAVYPEIVRTKNFLKKRINTSDYEGTYLSNRRVTSDFSKLIMQITNVEKIIVEASDSNTLSLLGYTFREETDDQFEVSNDSTVSFPIAFGRNETGNVDALYLPGRSDSFQKMQWHEHELIGLIIFVAAFIFFLIFSLVGVIRFVRHSVKFQPINGTHTVNICNFIYSIINFLFLALFGSIIIITGESFQYKLPSTLYLIFSLPIVGILTFLIMIYHITRAWNTYDMRKKTITSILFMLCLVYTWQLYYWNFIGFNF